MISVDKEIIPIQKRFSQNYNLEKLLFKLNLNNAFKVINIVGTNGKGSTSYYLSQALKLEYKKVGLFISPAFMFHNERIQINNEYISDNDLIRIINSIKEYIIDYNLTFFEIWTLICAIFFKENNVDIVVMEAGIGGLKDTTNLFSEQVITLITSISYDHVDVLGNTIEEIIFQKSGIVKKNKTVIISNDNLNYVNIIKNYLKDVTDKIYVADVFENENDIFQKYNKGLVKKCLDFLNIKNFNLKNLEPPLGRITILQKDPLFVIDGAHNVDAISKLSNYWKHEKDLNIICAFSKGKDSKQMLTILKNNFKNVLRVDFDHIKADNKNSSNWIEIVEKLYNQKKKILVCGSLYFIPQVYKWFEGL